LAKDQKDKQDDKASSWLQKIHRLFVQIVAAEVITDKAVMPQHSKEWTCSQICHCKKVVMKQNVVHNHSVIHCQFVCRPYIKQKKISNQSWSQLYFV
jgi:hypothetical protein